MAKTLRKIIGKSLKTVLIISMTVGMAMPAHATLLFTNDLFYNEAETFRIGEGDDASTTNISLEFGSTNSETLSWDFINSQFQVSNDVSLGQNQLKDVVLDNQASAPVTPSPGQIYYDTSNNNSYIWNGTSWDDITAAGAGTNEDMDDVYDNDLDKILDVDNASGLEFESTVTSHINFDLQSTGDFIIQDAGVTYATFTDTGELQVDNLQLDANTLSSINVNGNVTIDPNGNGFVNLGANVNVDGETVILDYDNTTGDITLQFGQALAETFKWNSAGSSFDFSDDVAIYDTLLVENTKPADSFRVNDEASDTTPFVIDTYGQVGIGTATPGVNFHLYDTTSTVAHEWQVFDNGTDQVSVLTGTQDPTSVATNADTGSIFLNSTTGKIYIKTDDGSTVNWEESGLSSDLLDALEGTYGTPSITNKFVTDEDPRLAGTSGSFGEVALGTHLGYPATNATVNNGYIYYTRVFLPADTTVSSFAIFTTQAKTGNVNYGIYSNNPATTVGAPQTKLAEVGVTASTSPIQDFWELSLGTPLDITTAGLYWLAYASSESPKAHQYLSAEDVFIPFRVESKAAGSAVLPATATPDTKGSSYNLPYLAAFE